MEIALYLLYAIAGILMVIAMLLTLADAVMNLRQRRRKKALLDRLEKAAGEIEEAIAADLAETLANSERHIFVLSEKDFEDDGR